MPEVWQQWESIEAQTDFLPCYSKKTQRYPQNEFGMMKDEWRLDSCLTNSLWVLARVSKTIFTLYDQDVQFHKIEAKKLIWRNIPKVFFVCSSTKLHLPPLRIYYLPKTTVQLWASDSNLQIRTLISMDIMSCFSYCLIFVMRPVWFDIQSQHGRRPPWSHNNGASACVQAVAVGMEIKNSGKNETIIIIYNLKIIVHCILAPPSEYVFTETVYECMNEHKYFT